MSLVEKKKKSPKDAKTASEVEVDVEDFETIAEAGNGDDGDVDGENDEGECMVGDDKDDDEGENELDAPFSVGGDDVSMYARVNHKLSRKDDKKKSKAIKKRMPLISKLIDDEAEESDDDEECMRKKKKKKKKNSKKKQQHEKESRKKKKKKNSKGSSDDDDDDNESVDDDDDEDEEEEDEDGDDEDRESDADEDGNLVGFTRGDELNSSDYETPEETRRREAQRAKKKRRLLKLSDREAEERDEDSDDSGCENVEEEAESESDNGEGDSIVVGKAASTSAIFKKATEQSKTSTPRPAPPAGVVTLSSMLARQTSGTAASSSSSSASAAAPPANGAAVVRSTSLLGMVKGIKPPPTKPAGALQPQHGQMKILSLIEPAKATKPVSKPLTHPVSFKPVGAKTSTKDTFRDDEEEFGDISKPGTKKKPTDSATASKSSSTTKTTTTTTTTTSSSSSSRSSNGSVKKSSKKSAESDAAAYYRNCDYKLGNKFVFQNTEYEVTFRGRDAPFDEAEGEIDLKKAVLEHYSTARVVQADEDAKQGETKAKSRSVFKLFLFRASIRPYLLKPTECKMIENKVFGSNNWAKNSAKRVELAFGCNNLVRSGETVKLILHPDLYSERKKQAEDTQKRKRSKALYSDKCKAVMEDAAAQFLNCGRNKYIHQTLRKFDDLWKRLASEKDTTKRWQMMKEDPLLGQTNVELLVTYIVLCSDKKFRPMIPDHSKHDDDDDEEESDDDDDDGDAEAEEKEEHDAGGGNSVEDADGENIVKSNADQTTLTATDTCKTQPGHGDNDITEEEGRAIMREVFGDD